MVLQFVPLRSRSGIGIHKRGDRNVGVLKFTA
jgi:hypothetical protein